MSTPTAEDTPTSDWTLTKPETLARPTWAPAALGFGITLTAWGLIVSTIVVVVGVLVMIASLVRWIGEIRDERRPA